MMAKKIKFQFCHKYAQQLNSINHILPLLFCGVTYSLSYKVSLFQ